MSRLGRPFSSSLSAGSPGCQAAAAAVATNSEAGRERITAALCNCLFGAMQATLAAKLLEEEWPDQAETAAARLAEREAATPVPERVWALRNVASTLVRPRAGCCYPRRTSHVENADTQR